MIPVRMTPARIKSYFIVILVLLALSGFLSACSGNSSRNHYLLAEKLWTDKNYLAAVSEFERVTAKDPNGRLGRQALYRAASTQMLFLSEYHEALKKFNDYVQKDQVPRAPASEEDHLAWDARVQMGEILFSKLEQYDQAIVHYQNLLKFKPEAKESQEFLFRIAKSYFYLLQFDEALNFYNRVIQKDPKNLLAERAVYEKALTVYTRGGHVSSHSNGNESYRSAYSSYEKFVTDYPKSKWVAEARFGMANCLEELNQLEDASKAYAELKGIYPAPEVIDVKLKRIRERLVQKSGAR